MSFEGRIISFLKNGKTHRENGPAFFIYSSPQYCLRQLESIEWRLNDKFHRTDGPACIDMYSDGSYGYFYGYEDAIFTEKNKDQWFSLLSTEEKRSYLWNLNEEI